MRAAVVDGLRMPGAENRGLDLTNDGNNRQDGRHAREWMRSVGNLQHCRHETVDGKDVLKDARVNVEVRSEMAYHELV